MMELGGNQNAGHADVTACDAGMNCVAGIENEGKMVIADANRPEIE